MNILDSSFRVLAEVSPSGIYLTDKSGQCLYVNPAWCKLSGFSLNEALGEGWIMAIHPDDKDRIYSEWKGFINGEIPWESEYRFVDTDGKITWVLGTATLIKEKGGKLAGVIGVNLDITERKEKEFLLKESEERYRTFFENSMDAILLTSPDGKIHSANPAACKLFDHSEEEICSMGRDGLVDLTDPSFKKALKERSDTGSYFGEFRMIKKSGERFPTEVSTAIFKGKEGQLLTTMIIRDITARKAYEERLKASEAEFRILFENSLLAISQAYPGGKFIRINQAYAEMYGFPDTLTMLNDIKNNTLKLYANPSDRLKVLEILDKSGYMEPAEFELKRRTGEKFWALVSARQVRDKAGKLICLQAEHIDITNLKKLEAELRESKITLEKLNSRLNDVRESERSQIALNLHDDFGQRFTALNLDIAWLKRRIGVQSETVGKKLQEMGLLINESIESIREVSSFLRPSILYDMGLVPAFEWQIRKFEKQSGIKCLFSCSPEVINISTDISLILYRVLQEALTNIIRHSEATRAEVTLRLVKNKLELNINDNGKGIEYNLVNSSSSMGIAGVKERISSVSGSVVIKGENGIGTKIKISIPIIK